MSDFKAKMHQIRFPLGLRPRPRSGSLQRSLDPSLYLKGLLLKGGRGKERGEVGKGRDGKGGEEGERRRKEEGGRRETKGFVSHILFFEPWQLHDRSVTITLTDLGRG